MTSIKFMDSSSERGKRIRLVIHLLNVIVVTFFYVLFVHKVGAEFGIDVNKPLREYENTKVFLGFVLMSLTLALLYGTSFKVVSWIFKKFRI